MNGSRLGRRGRSPRHPWEREATFHVDGLACRTCAHHAEEALARLPGVRAASVGFFGELAQVLYDARATSEREIVLGMAQRGFRMWPASGVAPSARARLDPARLGLTIALLGNLLALAVLAPEGYAPPELAWVELGFALLLLVVAGPPLAHRAMALARRKLFGKDALALVGALAALSIGLLALAFAPDSGHRAPELLEQLGFRGGGHGLRAFETAGAIAGFAVVVRYVYAALCRRAFADVDARAQAQSERARRLDAMGAEHPVAIASLTPGDRVRLMEGEIAPVDMVLDAHARVVEPGALLGRDRGPGDVISRGARLLSAEVVGRALGNPGAELAAAADAEVHRTVARIERDALQHAGGKGFTHITSLAISVAALSFAAFALVVHAMLSGGPVSPTAWLSALAVLVGFSPAAFTLALPAARTIAVLRARAAGVVVKDPAALDALARVDIACFDKTGTVTTGEIRVVSVRWLGEADPSVLEDVAAIEASASHPAGRAIASYLAAAGVRTAIADGPAVERTDGVAGRVRGALIEVSAARRSDPVPSDLGFGASVVYFRRNGEAIGCFELWDPARMGAEGALRSLWQRGVACRVVSSDRPEATLALAHRLGVPAVGGLSPVEKALQVRDLQHEGARVLYVGDGLHDGAGLSQADVALAIAPGSLPSAVDAPLVVTDGRLESVAWLVDLARTLRSRTRQSLVLAIVYNAAVIPLCAAGLVGPLAAAALGLGEALLLLAGAARMLWIPLPARTDERLARTIGRALPAPVQVRRNAPGAP
jgi:P-type E1-E2 ATPase